MNEQDIYYDRREELKEFQKKFPMHSLYMVVYECLKKEIISCRLAPGVKLKELDLADAFDVSRTTIRNAVDTLAGSGLVELKGRSLRVAPLTRAQYTQLHEFRRKMDPVAAALAADRYTKDNLEKLQQYLEDCNADDAEEFLEADSNFHHEIYVAAKNMFLLKAYDLIDPSRRRINYYSVVSISKSSLWEFSRSKRDRMRDEHKNILNAIRRADAEEAARLSELHVGSLLFDFDSYEPQSF